MNMSTIRPGGYLLQLPREIRDQIYGDYFNGTYPIYKSYHVSKDDESQDEHYQVNEPRQNGDLQACLQQTSTETSILRTSKVLHNDIKDFLLSKAAAKTGTYKYAIDLDTHEEVSNGPILDATEHMINVMFEVRVRPESTAVCVEADGYESKTESGVSFMDSICEATIGRFAGTAIVRENFRITYKADYVNYRQSFGYFTKTRFFRALRELTGFEQVTVALKWSIISGSHYRYEVRKGVMQVQLELRQYLGPVGIKKPGYRIDEVDKSNTYFTVELEFRPLKHHVQKLRADAVKLAKEESRLKSKTRYLEH